MHPLHAYSVQLKLESNVLKSAGYQISQNEILMQAELKPLSAIVTQRYLFMFVNFEKIENYLLHMHHCGAKNGGKQSQMLNAAI